VITVQGEEQGSEAIDDQELHNCAAISDDIHGEEKTYCGGRRSGEIHDLLPGDRFFNRPYPGVCG
jgi:hypothetical protein